MNWISWEVHTMDGNACRSPEQTDADFGARGPHTDVWGFAATVLHLATAEHPYRELTVLQMILAMLKAKPPSVPDTLPAWLQHLLKQCFSFDVSKRPPVFQLLQVKTAAHQWARVFCNLLLSSNALQTCQANTQGLGCHRYSKSMSPRDKAWLQKSR